jgi:hypothetical protein
MPVRRDAPRAEESISARAPSAHHPLENDAVVGKAQHPARLLTQNLLYSTKDPVGPAAIRDHLDIKRQTPISVIDVERLENLGFALDSNELAGLKIQHSRRGLAKLAGYVRVFNQDVVKRELHTIDEWIH